MYLFIVSHLGSGASALCDSLDKNIYTSRSNLDSYHHIKDLNPYSKLVYDKLVFNYQISSPSLYQICKFIYVVREAAPTLSYIVKNKGYSAEGAVRYYCFRLRRLCEMAKKTPGSVLATWDDIASERAFEDIKNHLGIKTLKSTYRYRKEIIDFPTALSDYAQERYEFYLRGLKHYIGI